jgi:hypothetical protein
MQQPSAEQLVAMFAETPYQMGYYGYGCIILASADLVAGTLAYIVGSRVALSFSFVWAGAVFGYANGIVALRAAREGSRIGPYWTNVASYVVLVAYFAGFMETGIACCGMLYYGIKNRTIGLVAETNTTSIIEPTNQNYYTVAEPAAAEAAHFIIAFCLFLILHFELRGNLRHLRQFFKAAASTFELDLEQGAVAQPLTGPSISHAMALIAGASATYGIVGAFVIVLGLMDIGAEIAALVYGSTYALCTYSGIWGGLVAIANAGVALYAQPKRPFCIEKKRVLLNLIFSVLSIAVHGADLGIAIAGIIKYGAFLSYEAFDTKAAQGPYTLMIVNAATPETARCTALSIILILELAQLVDSVKLFWFLRRAEPGIVTFQLPSDDVSAQTMPSGGELQLQQPSTQSGAHDGTLVTEMQPPAVFTEFYQTPDVSNSTQSPLPTVGSAPY